ncbi:7-cyano-7-deazaguanine synthase [Desulfosporosinus meridiei]|uniref:7-cyano-7-deazaguanine synthase n=1 Tax=Desulfosporosinus meridiei (strain ATCC BAA-275 / DSM 13257 / KCTC 12902 / NCIMB 13706 / S10) TaxID=768704 RepID=J7IUP9_DESMD|nr:7-cyano-7-deazaguanine synthase [Desulfosporosinus meridiei]AFQ42426.1 putative PP-loop superfamily ATPase [Desulfosporosinus meridiei DSM 13257]
MKSEILVLLSGGLDSTACVAYYLNLGFKVKALFVDYNQNAVDQEKKSAYAISNYYCVDFQVLKCSGLRQWGTGVIPGRNAFLLSIALLSSNLSQGLIAIGIHSGTSYYDCSPNFLLEMNNLFDCYTDGKISISAPFLNYNKDFIWQYCLDHAVPIELTYSCEKGFLEPCGSCLSCRDREVLRACKKK